MNSLSANFTVTITAVDQPPDNGGVLTWDSWYSTTSPTPTGQFPFGTGQTTFGAGTTTLTLTAPFTRTYEVPTWGFCQGLSFNQPVPGYYIIDVYANAVVHFGQPNPPVTSTSTYIQVS
jgi:hypothetical protein